MPSVIRDDYPGGTLTLNIAAPYNFPGIATMKAPVPLELIITSFTASNSKPGSLDTYTLVISVTTAIPVNSNI